jgi:hypothetical protein
MVWFRYGSGGGGRCRSSYSHGPSGRWLTETMCRKPEYSRYYPAERMSDLGGARTTGTSDRAVEPNPLSQKSVGVHLFI